MSTSVNGGGVIVTLKLSEVAPPADRDWVIRRREPGSAHVTYFTTVSKNSLNIATFTNIPSAAMRFAHLKVAEAFCGHLVEHCHIAPEELTVTDVAKLETTPVRERMLARTVSNARRNAARMSKHEHVDEIVVVRNQRDQGKQRGFGLLEILVSMAILLVMLAVVTPSMVKTASAANFRAARVQVQSVIALNSDLTTCAMQSVNDLSACDWIKVKIPASGIATPGPGAYTYTFDDSQGGGQWTYTAVGNNTQPSIVADQTGKMVCWPAGQNPAGTSGGAPCTSF